MTDKYTLADIESALTGCAIFDVIERAGMCSAIIRQLLDDHETMRRALEYIKTNDDASRPELQWVAEKALGEVTK